MKLNKKTVQKWEKLPDMDYWQNFSAFWSEETIIDLDWDCGSEFDEEIGYNLLQNYLNNSHLNRNI